MKTDSYPRFLKSDVYKESVLAEMENKPLPFNGEEEKSKDDVKKVKFLALETTQSCYSFALNDIISFAPYG